MKSLVMLSLAISSVFNLKCQEMSLDQLGLHRNKSKTEELMTFDIRPLNGSNRYFITTGANLLLWDIEAGKEVCEIKLKNHQSKDIIVSATLDESGRYLLIELINSIEIMSFPKLEHVASLKGEIESYMISERWDFILQNRDGEITKINYNGEVIDHFENTPSKVSSFGILQNDNLCYFLCENSEIGFAALEDPFSCEWSKINFDADRIEDILDAEFISIKGDYGNEISQNKKAGIYTIQLSKYIETGFSINASTYARIPKNKRVLFSSDSREGKNAIYILENDIVTRFNVPILLDKIENIQIDTLNSLILISTQSALVSCDYNLENWTTITKCDELETSKIFSIKNKTVCVYISKDKGVFLSDNYLKFPFRKISQSFGSTIVFSTLVNYFLWNFTKTGVSCLDMRYPHVAPKLYSYPKNVKFRSSNVNSPILDFGGGWFAFKESDHGEVFYIEDDRMFTFQGELISVDSMNSAILKCGDSLIKLSFDKKSSSLIDEFFTCIPSDVQHLNFGINLSAQYVYHIVYDEFDTPKKRRQFTQTARVLIQNLETNLVEVSNEFEDIEKYRWLTNNRLILLNTGQQTFSFEKKIKKKEENRNQKVKAVICNFSGNQMRKVQEIEFSLPVDLTSFDYEIFETPNPNEILLLSNNSLLQMNLITKEVRVVLDKRDVTEEHTTWDQLIWNEDKNKFVIFGFRGPMIELSYPYFGILKNFFSHGWGQNSATYFGEDELLTSSDVEGVFWNKTAEKIIQYEISNLGGIYLENKDDYYICDKEAIRRMHYFSDSLQVVGFDQLDPYFNRPDIVLKSISGILDFNADNEIETLSNAYFKRIEKLGIDDGNLMRDEMSFPVVHQKLNLAEHLEDQTPIVQFSVTIKDAKSKLKRFNVFVNEVPMFGSKGVNLHQNVGKEWDTTLTIPLSFGENKIQVAVMNELGMENFKYPVYAAYRPSKKPLAKTYYIGIGVNEFVEKDRNLLYCVNDVQDLKASLSRNDSIESIILLNEEVTRENVLELKKILLNTHVDDRVIISCSSHGLLDKKNNFFLAMHNTDFANPSINGLAYEELQGLLDSIPSRRKILLLDACNSGENERNTEEYESQQPTFIASYTGEKGVRLVRDSTEKQKTDFETMMELFVNVQNQTGAVIISAAGGKQSALESIDVDGIKIQNGAFTFCILEFLSRYNDENEMLTVNELKKYVENRVVEITNGDQRPTSRQETMELDWKLSGF